MGAYDNNHYSKSLDHAREQKKKRTKYESDRDTNCNWCAQCNHQKFGTRTRGFRNKRTNGDHPKYSIVEIGQNTEKSSGDLRKLGVTQTPLKKHQLTLE